MKVFYVAGDEPYFVDKTVREIIGEVEFADFNFMTCDIFSNNVIDFLQSYPFCGDRRVVYMTVDDLSEADIPQLKKPDKYPEFSTLVIRARSYDGRKSFTKGLMKEGLLKICSREQVVDKLVPIVEKMAKEEGLSLTKEVIDELLNREGYGVCEETTLYTIQADLRNLYGAFGEKPTKRDVASLVEIHDVGNSFIIADMIQKNDVCGLKRQAECLKGQEIPALSALLREYRLSYKSCCGFSNQEMGVYYAPKKMKRQTALSGIQTITNAILQFKTGAIPKSCVLLSTYLKLVYEAN